MDPENNIVPPAEIEPPTPPSLQTSNTTTPPIGPSRPAPQSMFDGGKKKHRLPLFIAITILVVIGLITGGFAVFYYIYRTPESKYDVVLKDLYAMRDDAKTIPLKDFTIDENYNISADVKRERAARAYIESFDNIKKSNLLNTDSVVRKEYDKGSRVIKEYGQSSLDLIQTVDTFWKVDIICRDALNTVGTQKSTKAFDAFIEECEILLGNYPHVPMKSFNEKYEKIVEVYKQTIDTYRTGLRAYESGNTAGVLLANKKLTQFPDQYKLATTDLPRLTNTANPTDQLNLVIKAVEQRKSVFFRR